jgi:hypothetical protein
MISILVILVSFAPMQAPVLASVRTSGLNRSGGARRPSPEAYGFNTADLKDAKALLDRLT